MIDKNWLVCETEFQRTRVHPQESVFTIGNGYVCTRGTFEEGLLGDLPATLIHGVFDDAPIVETELANAPDWLLRLTLLLRSSSARKSCGIGWRRSQWIRVNTPHLAPLVAMLNKRRAACSEKLAGKPETTRK